MRPEKIFIGLALLMLGLTLLVIPAGNVAYGGIILLGPVPIVFGSSPTLAAIGVIIGALLLILVYLVTIFTFRYKTR